MEFVVYVSIGILCVSILVGIPGIIWLVYDNKRREREEQEEASIPAVPQ